MASEPNLLQAVPFFAVSNMEKSLRFYVDGLRFEMADKWEDEGTIRWCRLVRGGAALMLQDFRRDGGKTWSPEGPLGLGVSIMFICGDAVSAYREFTARGLGPSLPFVGNGMWVTSLRDPDGYSIEFESHTDVPEDTTFIDEPTDAPEWLQHAVRGAADAAPQVTAVKARILGRSWQRVASIGLVYLGLGVGSAVISNDLESAPVQASIRVGILLVAIAVFCWHLRMELTKSAGRHGASALITASALALGTFLVAVCAVSTSWWDSSRLPTSLLWALLIWPVATGLPAFLGALVLGKVMARSHGRPKSQ